MNKALRTLVKRAICSGDPLPSRFFLSQTGSQQEVVAWLLGAGEPIDVTDRHCEASGIPLTICIEFGRDQAPVDRSFSQLILRLCQKDGDRRILSELSLQYQETLECAQSLFLLFHARRSSIRCLPRLKLWGQSIWHSYTASKIASSETGKIRISGPQQRAIAGLFCCPRPVFLIGVAGHDGIGNIYPFKVAGQLSREFVGFCLEHNGLSEMCVRQTRRVTLSSVPMQFAPIAYSIEQNHYAPAIGRQQIPFATRPSQLFKLPAPLFASRVRELQVERVRRLGYHTFFLARVVSDEQLETVPELCVAHGFYQDWRVKYLGIDKTHAAAENSYVSCPLTHGQAQHLATLARVRSSADDAGSAHGDDRGGGRSHMATRSRDGSSPASF